MNHTLTTTTLTIITAISSITANAATYGTSASERTLATVVALEKLRTPTLTQAQTFVATNKIDPALTALETYLTAHPEDIIAGNLYRSIAVTANLFDRPIRFFVALVKELTPCPKDPPLCPNKTDKNSECAKEAERCSPTAKPPGPPAGLRYNLAFGYIDKIPAVGPMGAGFLSKRSITQFQTALDADPNDWIANYGVGMNYLHWPDYFGKNDISIAFFDRAIAIQEAREQRPSDILAYVRLGDALAKADKIEPAFAAWQHGVSRLGAQADFTERLNIPAKQIKQAILDAYNPNNSIGAINTDISILWSAKMPATVFSLHQATDKVATGTGIGGQTAIATGDYSGIRLFNWFRDNLPLLMKREHADKVNMAGIGATNQEGVGIIAYNMIRGFMTQFRGDSAVAVNQALAQAPDYDRPFFHEGIGMGLAAALDTSANGSLVGFATQIGAFDAAKFSRLHYAGLGMWFGLAPTINLIRVRDKLNELEIRGQFYAYEGMGFAATLFKTQITPAIELVKRLPFALASTFAHGAGRALWIKHGTDDAAFQQALGTFPAQVQSDVRGGFGMGVAFTRIDRTDTIVERLAPFRHQSNTACRDYLTGVAMGLAIRYQTDASYVRSAMRHAATPQAQTVTQAALQAGLDALAEVEQVGIEMHQNWRLSIRAQFDSGPAAAVDKTLCDN